MAHISLNQAATQQNPYINASRTGQLASTVLFTITGIAMAALYALNPQGFLLQANYPALAILGSVGAAALASFVVNTVINCCASRKNVEELEEIVPRVDDPLQVSATNSGVHRIEASAPSLVGPAAPIVLQDPLSLELLDCINDTIDEVEKLILAFNAAYYRADGKKKPENEDEIRKGMLSLKTLIKEQAPKILNDKQKLVVNGINALLTKLADNSLILDNRNKTPKEFITSLPTILIDPTTIDSDDTQDYEHINKMLTQISANPDLLQKDGCIDAINELLQASRNYATEYLAKEGLDKTKKDAEDLEALANTFIEKRNALFAYLLKKALTPDQVEDFVSHVFNCSAKVIFASANNILLILIGGFGEEGRFNTSTFKTAMLAATTAPETTCSQALPADFPHRQELLQPAKTLLSALSNPLYYATCVPLMSWGPHAFYKGIKNLFEDQKMAPPDLDPETTDWRGYMEGYTTYLQLFTTRLNTMKF